MIFKNNYDHYHFTIKNLSNIVNMYFYEAIFQDESTYITFFIFKLNLKELFIVKN